MIDWLLSLTRLIPDWIAILGIIASACYIDFWVVRAAISQPRALLRALCGELALLFGMTALLWTVVVGERHGIF